MPGVAAYGSRQTRPLDRAGGRGRRRARCCCCRRTPTGPTARRSSRHYRAAAKVGLPIVAYNNPIDTKVDLTPDVLAQLFDEGLIVAVKEFTGDVRRAYEIAELAPGLDLLVGTDDVLLELGVAGAVGWIAGYPNALPQRPASSCYAARHLRRPVRPGPGAADLPRPALAAALGLQDRVRPGDQASMDVAGRKGGVCRPPRGPLPDRGPPPGDRRHRGCPGEGLQVVEPTDQSRPVRGWPRCTPRRTPTSTRPSVVAAAAGAAGAWAGLDRSARASAPRPGAVADAARRGGRRARADRRWRETHLAERRLRGELRRTTFQLRLFADVAARRRLPRRPRSTTPTRTGRWARRVPTCGGSQLPLGPVLVFAASNFPFAFSVAGGDTASALAAGCPVVRQGPPGPPRALGATAARRPAGPGRRRGPGRRCSRSSSATTAGAWPRCRPRRSRPAPSPGSIAGGPRAVRHRAVSGPSRSRSTASWAASTRSSSPSARRPRPAPTEIVVGVRRLVHAGRRPVLHQAGRAARAPADCAVVEPLARGGVARAGAAALRPDPARATATAVRELAAQRCRRQVLARPATPRRDPPARRC